MNIHSDKVVMSKPDKREDILLSALKLLAEQGFHGAPMAQIAEHAGVGTGTVYRYFENRDALILAVHRMINDELMRFLSHHYPEEQPLRECFFHIGNCIIDFFIQNPLKFQYNEQFFNSPYSNEIRRNEMDKTNGEYDLFHELYKKGLALQIVKTVPMAVFFDLAFAPIVWAVRDHHLGFVTLDKALSDTIVSACWDCIKL